MKGDESSPWKIQELVGEPEIQSLCKFLNFTEQHFWFLRTTARENFQKIDPNKGGTRFTVYGIPLIQIPDYTGYVRRFSGLSNVRTDQAPKQHPLSSFILLICDLWHSDIIYYDRKGLRIFLHRVKSQEKDHATAFHSTRRRMTAWMWLLSGLFRLWIHRISYLSWELLIKLKNDHGYAAVSGNNPSHLQVYNKCLSD